MVRSALALLLITLAACSPAEPPLLIDGGEQEGRSLQPQLAPEAHKAAIRADVQRRYGRTCGVVTLADDAFVPIKITADGADYALLFEHAICPRNAANWQNTGGTLTQFWTVSGERPHMLLEQHTYGFTPQVNGFDSLQHQNDCGPTSLALCVVSYRWDPASKSLKMAARRNLAPGSRMRWDYRSPQ